MTDQVLTALKVLFLALMYLFFARVLWAVWSEVRTPVAPKGNARAATAGAQGGQKRAKRAKGAASFVVIEPKEERGHRFTLSDVLTIGRDEDCDISMPGDSYMSGRHARIETRADGIWIVDLNSTNGVLVNGTRVMGDKSLHNSDRIQVGNAVLETKS